MHIFLTFGRLLFFTSWTSLNKLGDMARYPPQLGTRPCHLKTLLTNKQSLAAILKWSFKLLNSTLNEFCQALVITMPGAFWQTHISHVWTPRGKLRSWVDAQIIKEWTHNIWWIYQLKSWLWHAFPSGISTSHFQHSVNFSYFWICKIMVLPPLAG